MFIGDLNYDMLVSDKSSPLQNVCDIFYLTNLVKSPTCYTKNLNPRLNDVILTNMPNNCMNVTNFNDGISDVHNLIAVQIKGSIIQRKNELKSCRSFKHFSEQEFLKDLQGFNFNFNNISKHEDIDEAYSNFENSIIKTLDKHAPIKRRKHIPQPAPFMNKQLKQAIYKNRMLHNTFIKCKNYCNWERYRKRRNHANKIKKQFIKTYFYERCLGGPKSSDFWPTIKHFLSNKSNNCKKDIILVEDNKIINNQTEVSEIFNNFSINVAKDIGSSNIKCDESHPSI